MGRYVRIGNDDGETGRSVRDRGGRDPVGIDISGSQRAGNKPERGAEAPPDIAAAATVSVTMALVVAMAAAAVASTAASATADGSGGDSSGSDSSTGSNTTSNSSGSTTAPRASAYRNTLHNCLGNFSKSIQLRITNHPRTSGTDSCAGSIRIW